MRSELHRLLSAMIDPPRTVVACAELARRVQAVHVSFAVSLPGEDEQREFAAELLALLECQLDSAAVVDAGIVLYPLAVACFGDNETARTFAGHITEARASAREAATVIPEPAKTDVSNPPVEIDVTTRVDPRPTHVDGLYQLTGNELVDRLNIALEKTPNAEQLVSVVLERSDVTRLLLALAMTAS